jgi:hypothetical protein
MKYKAKKNITNIEMLANNLLNPFFSSVVINGSNISASSTDIAQTINKSESK